jgi:hypothetical protein
MKFMERFINTNDQKESDPGFTDNTVENYT